MSNRMRRAVEEVKQAVSKIVECAELANVELFRAVELDFAKEPTSGYEREKRSAMFLYTR